MRITTWQTLLLVLFAVFMTATAPGAHATLSENRVGPLEVLNQFFAEDEQPITPETSRVHSDVSYDFASDGPLASKGVTNTNSIRFTQDTIGAKFSDGRSVQGLVDGLKSGKVSPNDLPPIRTFQKDGLTYTLDNRRLFATHQAGVNVKTVPATTQEVARELPRKFTTRNQGTIIGIRGPLE